MKWMSKISGGIKIGAAVALLLLTIGFVEKQQSTLRCEEIVVDITGQDGNRFIDKNDLIALANNNGTNTVVGSAFTDLSLKQIEDRVQSNKFVKNVQVFKDLEGRLIIEAEQSKPIARVVQSDGPDAYVSVDGRVLPVSSKFTARVPLISGSYTKELVKNDLVDEEGVHPVFELLNFVRNDDFWQAQIAQIDIASNGNITLYPQIGKQYVEFGKAENIEDKFKRLMIFYKKILPQKGWNTYSRVNLKYKDQIICE